MANITRKQRQQRAKDLAYYPIALNVKKKVVVIAGGGNVALMKTHALPNAAAKVKIVSPEILPKLKQLHIQNKIKWIKKPIRSSDLNGAMLVFAATSDETVNQNVSKWAKKKKILVNVADQPDLSTFISPAVFSRNEAIVAVYSDGISPRLSRDIKNFLNDKWDEFISYRKSIQ